MSNLKELRVVDTRVKKEEGVEQRKSYKPVPGDLDSGIDTCLRESGQQVFKAHGIRLLSMDPTSRHTPKGLHKVLWLDRGRYRKPKPWTDEDPLYVAENHIFWREFERYLAVLRQDHPKMWAYMSLGFHDPAKPVPEGAHFTGMQSQRRLHIHLVDPFIVDESFPIATSVEPWELSYNLNVSGERTQYHFANDERLSSLGSPFTYGQKFGDGSQPDDFTFYRRMHGFEDIHQAFRGVTKAQQDFAHDWHVVTESFAEKKFALNGYSLPLIQVACPGFALIIPSDEDRINGSVAEEFGAWVIPFFASAVPPILTPGGMILRR